MGSEDFALENEKRRMIFNHINAYPGVSFNILKNIFELTDGALRYHLDYLEKNDKINCGLDKGVRCYYPNAGSVNVHRSPGETLELYKLTPRQEQVLDTIKLYPGINQKELVDRTRISRFQLSKEIKKLIDLNLVNKYQSERNVCYEFVPDEELKFKIIRRLVIKFIKNEIDEEKFLQLVRSLE
ncbi:MAG: MarR family transcriptional regulator [Thermoplasmata archaeon]|nr:MAG: MarR family transcriptional regulator [Thermoplasmata archaeon]